MADGGGWPYVVHGPYHGLAAAQYLSDARERQHALVYPVQVYKVGLLELPQPGYVGSGVGYVYIEQMLSAKVQMAENHKALPQEVPLLHGRLRQLDHGKGVGILIAHKHLCLYAVVVQSLHQPVGCNCRTACPLAGIYH